MVFNQYSRAIALFPSLEAAAQGFDRLILSGFPLEKVFLMGPVSTDAQNSKTVQMAQWVEHPGTITGTALGLTKGLVAGNVAGGVTGVLMGLGILALPGIGQIAFTSAVILTLISGGMGVVAGGMIGSLVGLGMTEGQAKYYSKKVSQGYYLLIVSGTGPEITSAERLLSHQGVRL